ncbi:MAG: Iron complex transport system substrate-binding protein [Bradyrhizobium sp.]|nr:Iron complex transport system substrate-binding protein [Bradyrhizobium sp.]
MLIPCGENGEFHRFVFDGPVFDSPVKFCLGAIVCRGPLYGFFGHMNMVETRRIVSFLPSATEMICALGLGDRLLGVTHECDYPPEIMGKTIVVRNVLPIESMSQSEIDSAVTQRLRSGLSLYQVDETLMQEIAPDLVVTQDLCQVCAPSGNEVSQLLKVLPSKPQILWLTPKSLEQIFDNLRDLGEATGRFQIAETLIAEGRARLEKVEAATLAASSRPRVFCMEWMDPVYCCGHWVPEMVRIAGGIDKLGREGADSVRIAWKDVLQWRPEILIVMPCGFGLEKAAEQAQQLSAYPGWADLPAVRARRVYAVDANSYFARPGPRIVEGTELLAHLLHPDLFEWKGSAGAFRSLE